MRVAALYDVHGNLPALEAVLTEVEREGIDEIVCGGDVVWGPFPSECLALLRSAGATFLAGNCEREVLAGESEKGRWCRDRLDEETRAFIASWPLTLSRDVEGLGRVLFCHATPRSDLEIVTTLTPDEEVAESLSGVDADLVVCGHTHVQYDRRVPDAPRLVNVGSVGLAYEGLPTACWGVLAGEVQLRREPLDPEVVLAALHETGFPDVHEVFDEAIRGQHTADEVTAFFESQRRGA